MTNSEANAIDLKNESDIKKLKELIEFWQEKASNAEKKLDEFKKKLLDEALPTSC